MKKIITLCLLIMILIAACKKDSDEPTLKGQWNVEDIVTKEYRNGTENTVTEPGNGYKYNFQDNGELLITAFLVGTTMPYTILPGSKVNIDGDIFEIRNLSSSRVTLFTRIDYVPGEYDELAINLKR